MLNKIRGNLVDVFKNRIYPAEITIINGIISEIKEVAGAQNKFLLPGLIDSHIHIESSMLTPGEFSRIAVQHGTVATISDPHEIANVLGIEGVDYMIKSGSKVPFKFFFGAPSCVPATAYETSGAIIDHSQVKQLLSRPEIYYLSEMMNYPGVIKDDVEIFKKINIAKEAGKPIDGHAPGLAGADLLKYIDAGISTDHECINPEEAREKILAGMKIQIREGSAAKGFDTFASLIDEFPESVMLCSDDKHPDDLLSGHINNLLARGVKMGLNIYNLIRSATLNPVMHYNIPVGLLRAGDPADIVIVDDLEDFKVYETWIDGERVFRNGNTLFDPIDITNENTISRTTIDLSDLKVAKCGESIRVIQVKDGELYTEELIQKPLLVGDLVVSDPERDICKIVVVNRYQDARPAVGFVSGFGIKKGAIAGSVAHDSHNIIAVGADDQNILDAINHVIAMKGGLAAVNNDETLLLQLEVAGLMTSMNAEYVAERYRDMNKLARSLGSNLESPFMTLSFMSLLVIPELKIGDRGLFNVVDFTFTPLFT